jgi:two-component system, chemotaxis family, sensor kinase CheA
MKPQPQDWTQRADIHAAPVPRGKAPIVPPRARSLLIPFLGAPLLAAALWLCWLAAQRGGLELRAALLGAGMTLALLLPGNLYLRRRAQTSAVEVVAAQRQLVNILGSLHEGLFLIGRDLRLGATGSASMRELLRLSAPAGRRFEDVLRPLLLNEETLAAALTFLQLLWSDEADEHAVESLNPLSQVEVSFANAHGGSERRYLSFSFRRVAGSAPADDCILAVVADVTDRVLLARELERAEAEADSQAELLLQLVRTDPVALVTFLDDADNAFRKSNAILSATGIGQPQLHKKLIGVLRELDAVTTEAEALPFASFTQRLQSIDQLLSGLCAKSSLIGNDFLPAVVRLDELMSHAASMRAIHQHIVLLRAASAALAAVDERDSIIARGPKVFELS